MPAELQLRKKTIIASLQQRVQEKKEIPNGISLRFDGSDEIIDLLASFMKTERECCTFFQFSLSVGNTEAPTWLTLSGPEGAKEFIARELGF